MKRAFPNSRDVHVQKKGKSIPNRRDEHVQKNVKSKANSRHDKSIANSRHDKSIANCRQEKSKANSRHEKNSFRKGVQDKDTTETLNSRATTQQTKLFGSEVDRLKHSSTQKSQQSLSYDLGRRRSSDSRRYRMWS